MRGPRRAGGAGPARRLAGRRRVVRRIRFLREVRQLAALGFKLPDAVKWNADVAHKFYRHGVVLKQVPRELRRAGGTAGAGGAAGAGCRSCCSAAAAAVATAAAAATVGWGGGGRGGGGVA